ncbi:MAG: hypothetical protein EOO62_39350 [Hymenobacter sp.]|nr:MAG: hypothetical protein EOO62_39350 [Hymenobacter sp.]
MKTLLLLVALSGAATMVAQAQTVPFDASAPMRGGAQNQTSVPPINPGLNQSTIQGPAEVQRTLTTYDAQPSRLPVGTVPIGGTPELSPNTVPDVREQPLIRQQRNHSSTDVVPTRSRVSNSSNVQQTYRRPVQAPLSPVVNN